ncbi:Imm52 family immunity protein [Rhodococcus spongiicola]|uniref:Immunity protein 52 domain-containing protein n=1 Tax=Rhodococcus spongiicola TaxID=2487352 RepID=A0A438B5Q3_9NOCA|nr:hypothetical protein [Rhodococcus spongiicola]RVW06278.1 hypothetical protein EF834_02165 [Rhodococcus spongiicola]
MERLYSNARWGGRAQTPLECAHAIRATLAGLPDIQGYYTSWRISKPEASAPEDLHPVPIADDALADYVESTALRNDRGELMPGGGFTVRFARLHDGHPVKLEIRCGADDTLGNNILLEFPHPDWASPESLDPIALRESLAAIVEPWDADYGFVITHPFRKAQGINARAARRGERPVGWLTYVGHDIDLDSAALTGLARVDETTEGVWIELHGSPSDPSFDDALTVRRALGYGN